MGDINLINISLSADYVGVERYSSLLNVLRKTILCQRKRSIKYKRTKIWNALPVSMRSFPSISQFNNKFIIEAWVPAGIFFRGAKATPSFPISALLLLPLPVLFPSLLPSHTPFSFPSPFSFLSSFLSCHLWTR